MVAVAVALCALAALAGLLGAAPGSAAAKGAKKLPHIKHVFIVVLENENADDTFGPDAPKYLAKKLPSKGLLMPNYYGIGHFSNDNYLAMVSGQAPNPDTQADCEIYSDFIPGIRAADGQVIGVGCVYPASVKTIGNQLHAKGRRWRGYMEDMAAKAPAEPAACRHPDIGVDDTQAAEAGDQYATRHNPFMYFHSIIDNVRDCKTHVVDYKKLTKDLRSRKRTPAYSFITPNLCHDGHDAPCVDGAPGGLVSANQFLRQAIPPIMHSAAYKDHGLIVITFDEAENDSSACCNEQSGPNTVSPGGILNPGPGGGRVGAVVLSPCIRPGTKTDEAYNHYSLLRSVEDNFGLAHLGYAGQDGLRPFGSDVLNKPRCGKKKHRHKHVHKHRRKHGHRGKGRHGR